MIKIAQDLKVDDIQKIGDLIGLSFSESELKMLATGNFVSLKSRGLSEIGSVLILAEALSNVMSASMSDSLKISEDSGESIYSSEVPIYCWKARNLTKHCLFLTVSDCILSYRIQSNMCCY